MRHKWLPATLAGIRELAAQRKVRFTPKALQALAALDLGLDQEDACGVLLDLAPGDLVKRRVSRKTGEWMYVFEPTVAGTVIYVKMVLRDDCVVISFHDEGGEGDESD
ncbi:MAG: hypothetical protein A3K12_04060 [Candidatus Rokubacteria bacterium RIFCSPLOWO2_12_FULL_71_19]|nr:MAG: hypothetical protein A3K12_04060 [Candidatus Rokubacteria bacterium RIFCSPLOWO2_12_FULL_71_19]